MIVADTARLRLRTAVPGDAAFYLALVNDPGFIEHIGDRGIRNLADAARALVDGPGAMQRARGHSLYVVELKDNDEAVGMCGLIKRDTLDGVDLGYAFLEAWRGRGFAYESACAVLQHARELGMTRLLAITTPGNLASNCLLRKLGFGFERVMRLDAGDAGTNLYSIGIG